MPEYVGLVKLHQERRPIFSRYQIEEQIETISRNKVPLPSGGSIVIDTHRGAGGDRRQLSGRWPASRMSKRPPSAPTWKPPPRLARQLRLRDLGGLIVIDFIDMRDRKHNREVEKPPKDALQVRQGAGHGRPDQPVRPAGDEPPADQGCPGRRDFPPLPALRTVAAGSKAPKPRPSPFCVRYTGRSPRGRSAGSRGKFPWKSLPTCSIQNAKNYWIWNGAIN